MSDYDFDSWLAGQSGLDYEQLKSNTFNAMVDAELRAKGLRPVDDGVSKEQYETFAVRVKALHTLLAYGEKDVRVSDDDWQTFRPHCEALVAKNQMDAGILDKFQT